MTILITGATGSVGRSLAAELTATGAPVRALVRDPERARALLPGRVEPVTGDFADPASLAAAVAGVEQVFLAAPNHPDQVAWESAVIEAAGAAGVRRIVKLSAHGARPGSEVAFWAAHAEIEHRLARSGLEWVALRPTTFTTAALGGFDGTALVAPAAGARVSFIDPDDVAACGAVALRDRRRSGVLTLTGAEALGFGDVATVLSGLLGRAVPFVAVPDAAARAAFAAAGMPPWYADNVVRVFAALRAGVAELTTGTVPQLLGRAPVSLARSLAARVGASAIPLQ